MGEAYRRPANINMDYRPLQHSIHRLGSSSVRNYYNSVVRAENKIGEVEEEEGQRRKPVLGEFEQARGAAAPNEYSLSMVSGKSDTSWWSGNNQDSN